MSIQNLLNQFIGAGGGAGASKPQSPSAASGSKGVLGALGASKGVLGALGGSVGGVAGGAAAGGLLTLLMGSKKTRKFAGKAATVGGAAVLGGLAYSAFKRWQQNQAQSGAPNLHSGHYHQAAQEQTRFQSNQLGEDKFTAGEVLTDAFQLTLVKAMISAAMADGHISSEEQARIFQATEQLQLTPEMKALLFDLMRSPATVDELAAGIGSIEQKSELYLASCLAIDIDQDSEREHLRRLAVALNLPDALAIELQAQAQTAVANAA